MALCAANCQGQCQLTEIQIIIIQGALKKKNLIHNVSEKSPIDYKYYF